VWEPPSGGFLRRIIDCTVGGVYDPLSKNAEEAQNFWTSSFFLFSSIKTVSGGRIGVTSGV